MLQYCILLVPDLARREMFEVYKDMLRRFLPALIGGVAGLPGYNPAGKFFLDKNDITPLLQVENCGENTSNDNPRQFDRPESLLESLE
jgi:hypothetical protein